MTTLASSDIATSRAALLSYARLRGGAFPPALGNVMMDNNPSEGGGGSCGKHGVDGCRSKTMTSGRCKRELEPERAEEAPRAKRISPIPFTRHDRARKTAEAEVWRADASPPTANESGSLEGEDLTRDAVAEARTTDRSPESGLLGQVCPSPLSFPMESDGAVDFESSNASSDGDGDGGFSPALENPMTDSNPMMDGGGRTGSRQSSSRDGCAPSTSSRRQGRAREPGEEDKPAPAKRMFPVSFRRRNGVSGGPDSEIWRVDPSPLRDSIELDSPHLEGSENEDSSEVTVIGNRPQSAPRVRSCLSPSLKRENNQSEDYGELKPGGEEERPPPPTAISQIPSRRHDRASRGPDATAFLNLDAFITNDTSDSGLLELENLVGEAVPKANATGSSPELELLDYSCLSSLQLASGGNFGEDNENGGGGDSELPLPLPLPQALDPSLAVATCFSSSLLDTATTRTLGPPPIQANTMSTDRFLRPHLLGRAASDGELLRRSRRSMQGLRGLGPKLFSPSPLRVDNCRWNVLKPSHAQEESAGNVSNGGSDCPEMSCESVEPPLGGDLKASITWDGGCASRAPPGCGVGFSTLPALCGSGGNSGCGSGSVGTEGHLGDADDGSKNCSCNGVLTPSITCLSPLIIARGTSTESTGGGSDQRLSADFDVFGDNMLSHALLSSPPLELVEDSSRKDDRGGGRAAGEVEGLEFVIPDMNIEKCMATLQATPTDAGAYEENSVQLSSPLSCDPCDDGGSCGTDHSDADEAQEAGVVIDTQPKSSGGDLEAEGEDDGEIEQEEEEQEGDYNRGEPEIRIGDAHQAVIPDIMYRAGNRVVDSSLARAPPLQLWSPGIVPERALDLAFPRLRRGGAGSSDLEDKMLSAYLIARESERELKRCDGRAAATNDGGRLVCSFGGADDDAAASISPNRDSHDESTESLETLAEVVAEGAGCVWRSDWPEKDREAFRKGIYVFRRDFSRIRAAFLPHREHGDLVDFYYRRWKRNPEYFAWKNTDQLIGRSVAQRVESNETRQGAGLGKCPDALGTRKGCVVRKKLRGWKEMFVVRFPPNGSSQATFETVPLGILETMLVEDSTTDEERTSEAHDGARAAQNLGEIAALNAGAWFSPGRSASSPATGSLCDQLDPRPPLGASTHMRGRCLGWQTGGSDSGDIDEEELEQNDDIFAVVSEVGDSRKTGDRDGADWIRMPRNMQAEDGGNADEEVNKDEDEDEGVYEEDYVTEKEGNIDQAEGKRETEEAHASGTGLSDSDSGPETDDNTENVCATASSPGERESRYVVYGARDEVAHGARHTSVGEGGVCSESENCPSSSIHEGKQTDFFASVKDMNKIRLGALKFLTYT